VASQAAIVKEAVERKTQLAHATAECERLSRQLATVHAEAARTTVAAQAASKERELSTARQQLQAAAREKAELVQLLQEARTELARIRGMRDENGCGVQPAGQTNAAVADSGKAERPLETAPVPKARSLEAAREAAWSFPAFLDQRQRSPHVAHPSLCVHARDRDEFTCQLCFRFVDQPILMNNGSDTKNPCGDGPFCQRCIRDHLGRLPACPVCQQATKLDQIVEDTRTERALRGVIVHCAFCAEGCDWTGEVRDFVSHHQKCNTAAALLNSSD
jgi:hypothetical protein